MVLIFVHEKLNRIKPGYCNGSMVCRKISDNNDNNLNFSSPLNGQCFEGKMTEAIWDKVDYVEKSKMNYFQQLNHWRNQNHTLVSYLNCYIANQCTIVISYT